MYIYFNEINGRNYVYGYGSELEENSIEVPSVPEEIDKYLSCYYVVDDRYILDEKRKEWVELQWSTERELNEINRWFAWYDEQCIQYQRAMRLGLEFNRDINELDAEAVSKATRIKELRAFLETPYVW